MKFLTTEQKNFYDVNGYIVLDILTDEEISQLSDEYDQLFQAKADSNTEGTWDGDWKKDKQKNVSLFLFWLILWLKSKMNIGYCNLD